MCRTTKGSGPSEVMFASHNQQTPQTAEVPAKSKGNRVDSKRKSFGSVH